MYIYIYIYIYTPPASHPCLPPPPPCSPPPSPQHHDAERLESLQRFKEVDADVHVCTDLAARGLDIAGIQTVINAEMPRTRCVWCFFVLCS